MKRITTALLLLCATSLYGQRADFVPFDQWDKTCYCNVTVSMPQNILSYDSNWQIVWALRSGGTTNTLDSLAIPYTQSQLALLKTYRLLTQDGKELTSTVIIIDTEQTAALRAYSLRCARQMLPDLEPSIRQLHSLLAGNGRKNNAFSILFSYVLDGLVWKQLNDSGVAKDLESRDKLPLWDGTYWMMRPARPFACGTNSLSVDGKRVFCHNWSYQSSDVVKPLYRFANLEVILRAIDGAPLPDNLKPFGFFDSEGKLTIPVIDETNSNPLYTQSRALAEKVALSFTANVDTDKLLELYPFKDTDDAVVVFYHELLYDLLDLLIEKGVIVEPAVFASPDTATPADAADACFVIVK